MPRGQSSFLNGIPELVVLRLLSQREMYGYEIVQAIREKSRAALQFGEGCIYPYLHYLEESKLVSSQRSVVDGRNRVYYLLTAKGSKRLETLLAEWQQVAHGVGLLLAKAGG